jgi:hypothetical protein
MDAFEAFGQKLGPILGELGVDAGEPSIVPLQALLQSTQTIQTW